MTKGKIKPHLQKSLISKSLERSQFKAKDLNEDDCLVISLKQFDDSQGQSFDNWQSQCILAEGMQVLKGLCADSLRKQFSNKKFTIYGGFPSKEKTDFFHPKHVPEDAEWARIHVSGRRCMIGHVVMNKFFLIFLDSEHCFWKSQKI